MKTYSATQKDLENKWILIDAEGVILGRLASKVANILRGKHKATYTPNMDCGDNVIIVNAEKVKLTGKKMDNKVYYRHTGHPGGVKEAYAGKLLAGKYPERVIEKAVERMLPKESPLARQQFTRLKVFKGPEHAHTAQQPVTLDFAAQNPKNKR